jgi:Spy/CpxP family protein refolding chaperone
MTTRSTRLAVAAVVYAAALTSALADASFPPLGMADDSRILAALHANATRLGLNDETVAAVAAILAEGKANLATLNAERASAREALRRLLSAPTPDEAAVMAEADRIADLDAQRLKLRLQTLLRIRPLFTAAQIDALHTLRGQRRAAFEDACRSDVATWCSDALLGPEQLQCLGAHDAELSAECRSVVSGLRLGHSGLSP